MKAPRKATPPYAMFELFGYVLGVLPGALAWSVTSALAFRVLRDGSPGGALLLAACAPIVLAGTFIAAVRGLRACLPALRPGIFRLGKNAESLAWFAHLSLNRSVKVSGLRYLIHSSYFLKFLLFRALGAKIAYGVHTPMEMTLVDLPLITVGRGCSFGENVYIGCHIFQGDRVVLRPVVLGEDVFVGMNSVLGPGTEIAEGSWIGFGNILGNERLGPGTKILDQERRDKFAENRRTSSNRSKDPGPDPVVFRSAAAEAPAPSHPDA